MMLLPGAPEVRWRHERNSANSADSLFACQRQPCCL